MHAPYHPLSTPLSPSLAYQSLTEEDFYGAQTQSRQMDHFAGNSVGYSGMATQNYGSPPSDLRLGLSPPVRAMDATLPASFDSQGISHMARYGPAAASVPANIGLGHLVSTSPTMNSATMAAFGNLNHLATSTANGNARSYQLASSPPMAVDDIFPRKLLHSEIHSKPQMIMSSSLPGPRPFMDDLQVYDSDGSEEELFRVPGALSDDLLTPSEKMRRFSRPEEDNNGFATRQSLSGFGSPSDSKVGSPSNASPSSRYGALFARRQREDNPNGEGLTPGSASVFGHVGSPLRKSSLQTDIISATAAPAISRSRSGDVSSLVMSSSPGSQRASAGGLSMLSQQFRKIGLNSTSNSGSNTSSENLLTGASNNLHSAAAGAPVGRGRPSSQSSMASALGIGMVGMPPGVGRLDRTISGGSIGRGHDRIDEECLFSMEEDEGIRKEKEREKETQRSLRPWSVVAARGRGDSGAQASGGSPTSAPGGVSKSGGQKNEA